MQASGPPLDPCHLQCSCLLDNTTEVLSHGLHLTSHSPHAALTHSLTCPLCGIVEAYEATPAGK